MIILSVKPEFAFAICDRRKTIEFRKTLLALNETVLLYATSPIKRIVGACVFTDVERERPAVLRFRFGGPGMVCGPDFADYFKGHFYGFAYEIKYAAPLFEPANPKDMLGKNWRPPQSWCHIKGLEVHFNSILNRYCLHKAGSSPAGS